jgi:hypothetical protein
MGKRTAPEASTRSTSPAGEEQQQRQHLRAASKKIPATAAAFNDRDEHGAVPQRTSPLDGDLRISKKHKSQASIAAPRPRLPFPEEKIEGDLPDFDAADEDDRGVRTIDKTPDDLDEKAHESRLAGRKPGDVWALYEPGTGLPRWYCQLLEPDWQFMCNKRPARWKVVFLDRKHTGPWATGGIGCHFHERREANHKQWEIANFGDALFSHPASVSSVSTKAGARHRHACLDSRTFAYASVSPDTFPSHAFAFNSLSSYQSFLSCGCDVSLLSDQVTR